MSEEVKEAEVVEEVKETPEANKAQQVPFDEVFDSLINTIMEIKRNYKQLGGYAEAATKRIKELEVQVAAKK